MNKPEKQHFIPKMLLKRFAVNDKLFVFDKEEKDNEKADFKQINIDNVAKIKKFYTITCIPKIIITC